MMSRILGNHQDIFSFQELHYFDEQLKGGDATIDLNLSDAVKLYAKLCNIQRNGYFGNQNITPFLIEAEIKLKELNSLQAIAVYKKFIFDETSRNHKSIPCKQTPQNVFALDQILATFPDCKAIVMIRDPREVLLSQKNKWKRRQLSGGKIPLWESLRSRVNYHPITISKIWNAAVNQGFKFKNDPRVLYVYYEKLLRHPELELKEVCKHIGIPYTSELLDIPIAGSSNIGDFTDQRGIDSSKTGQWRKGGLSNTEIALCEKLTERLMHETGYELSGIKPNTLSRIWYSFSLPFSLFLAVLFNIKRLKNPVQLIQRFNQK
ncbi:MAG: sulfotransferase [Bacteroidetes bacterium]|nr:sulfotransferase [Bacteroidota bacterium]